jgi:hypothetical protein
MKTIIALLSLFLFIACKDLQEAALPMQYPSTQVKALGAAGDDYSLKVLETNVGDELCGSYPACNQMIAEVGIILQQQANLYCTPVYACGTCCMGNDIAYVLFYKEPNSIICGNTSVSSPALNIATY